MPVDVLKADEGVTFELAGIGELRRVCEQEFGDRPSVPGVFYAGLREARR